MTDTSTSTVNKLAFSCEMLCATNSDWLSVVPTLRALAADRDALQWKLDAILNDTGQRPLLDKIDALTKQRDVIMVINKDLRRRLCGTGTDVGMEGVE